jgi:hypothetical protein
MAGGDGCGNTARYLIDAAIGSISKPSKSRPRCNLWRCGVIGNRIGSDLRHPWLQIRLVIRRE